MDGVLDDLRTRYKDICTHCGRITSAGAAAHAAMDRGADEIERLRAQQTGLLTPMTIRGAIGVIWFMALILLAAAGGVALGAERWLITFALVALALTPIASAVDLTRRYWRAARTDTP